MTKQICLSLKCVGVVAFAIASLVMNADACAQKPRGNVIDIVSVDLSGIPDGTPLSIQLGIRDAFYKAEAFWESNLLGFSPALPGSVHRQLRPVQITASVVAIDGPGGILGQAGPTGTLDFTNSRPYVISQAASMEFDSDDVVAFQAMGLFDAIAQHEMAHAIGFGSLWTENRLNLGPLGNYTGAYALKRYRTEARKPNALFVPVEQLGGGGTAGAHWDSADPFFFDARRFGGDVMIGFITNAPVLTRTTLAAFADLGFRVRGENDSISGSSAGSGRGPRVVPAAAPASTGGSGGSGGGGGGSGAVKGRK
jgi:hypothetical protein